MSKTALCIGINYKDTDHELSGCLNDADTWHDLLKSDGFKVKKLLEKEATKMNIVSEMAVLLSKMQAGDVACITFSGHGTWVPDMNGEESDGRDEALVPFDMGDDGSNLILDDEIGGMFAKIPAGAHLIFITDCCHSGTIYRMMLAPQNEVVTDRKVRLLPPANFLKSADLLKKMDLSFGQPIRKRSKMLAGVIHFSGCKDTEYSIDASINNKPCGAFTYYASQAFRRGRLAFLTYAEIFANIREYLPNASFPQTPQLSGTPTLKKTMVFGEAK